MAHSQSKWGPVKVSVCCVPLLCQQSLFSPVLFSRLFIFVKNMCGGGDGVGGGGGGDGVGGGGGGGGDDDGEGPCH